MAERAPSLDERLVMATYNVHAWIGTDRRFDPARTCAVIRNLRADVVGLQEVTLGPEEPTGIGRRDLGDRTGMQVVLGPTLKRGRADFGNALLTSLPIRAVRRHDISCGPGEPRGVVDVDLDIRGKTVRVLTAHFGKGITERRLQAVRVVELIEHRRSDAVVLMGDINEWLPGRTCLDTFNRWFGEQPRLRTYPAQLPLLTLDRIWVWPAALARSYRVPQAGPARVASDHLPLQVELTAPA